jgi:hypothetical protein
MTPEDFRTLEQRVDRQLRAQPARTAPATLHARVLAELARREALPWRRRSLAYWPLPLRVAFLLACMAGAWASLRLVPSLIEPFSRPLSWLDSAGGWVSFLDSLFAYVGSAVLHSLPAPLLYGGVLGLGALYALLAGIGVAAYRTLYIPVEPQQWR